MHQPRSNTTFQLACVALVLATVAAGAGRVSADEVARRVFVMGTWLDVTVTASDRPTAILAAEAAFAAVESTETRLSTWRPDSELTALNSARTGTWVALSPELARDLREAFGWARQTRGWFNPVVASLARAWDLRGDGRIPSQAELGQALAGAHMEAFELRGSQARRMIGAAGVEEGGFGKGVALRDAATAALAEHADCVRLDFGGQTHAAGSCSEVSIGIADPRDRTAVVANLPVASGSVATSGNGERGIVVDGVRLGHLLDPHSGRPAPDFGSVTVLAADPVAADCLSTALFAMGPTLGPTWLESQEGIEVVYVIDRGETAEIHASGSLLTRISIQDSSVVTRVLPAEDEAERNRPRSAAFSGSR
jgi:thiamine biosynthesis lipoprotein